MKVLVVRFSSIGDIVLTTPVLRCLKQQRPDIQIHFLTKSSFKPVVDSNPNIDKCHYLDDDFDSMLSVLLKERFDYVIDLHNNIRSLRIKRLLKCKSCTVDKLNIRKWLLVNFKWKTMPDKSIVERYLDTVKELGVKNDGEGLEYHVPDDAEVTQKDIPMSHWAGYVACVIGGSFSTKQLPVAKWKEYCKNSPYPIILLGGADDSANGEEIAAVDKVKVYNACGKFNLSESALLVKYAKVVVSNDTGLMHIAAAFKKPVVSLWGNTVPEIGMFPYYGGNNLQTRVSNDFKILEVNGLGCRPCSKIGYNKCPKGHFKCMEGIETSWMLNNVDNYWNTSQPKS